MSEVPRPSVIANLRHRVLSGVALHRTTIRFDIAAGLTVGAMLIPQAMAYALLAGLPPEVGLYASIVPLLVYALAGSSPQLAVGPVAVSSLMTAAALHNHVDEGTAGYLGAAAALAVLVGVVHVVIGWARLGSLVRLLTPPVLAGFTTAVALVIGVGQLDQLIGVKVPRSDRLLSIVWNLGGALEGIHASTTLLSIGCVLALIGMRRASRAVPAALVVVVLSTITVAVLGLEGRGVRVVGDIPGHLPLVAFPDVSSNLWLSLVPAAVMITLVGFVQSFAVAKLYADRGDYHVDANRELVGLGLANVAAGFFQGYSITGGLARTAVNVDAGARTRAATVISALVVLATVVLLTPAFRLLPRAALAAIIVVAVVRMIDLRALRSMMAADRADAVVLWVTFGATAALGLQLGIATGVAASIVAAAVRRIQHRRDDDDDDGAGRPDESAQRVQPPLPNEVTR
ncbi:MAG: hypothetical protein KDB21_19690 [Acidimicrobiales bacterium]|nr:hypothetical protein [Acidimicrobiales bacterium]